MLVLAFAPTFVVRAISSQHNIINLFVKIKNKFTYTVSRQTHELTNREHKKVLVNFSLKNCGLLGQSHKSLISMSEILILRRAFSFVSFLFAIEKEKTELIVHTNFTHASVVYTVYLPVDRK